MRNKWVGVNTPGEFRDVMRRADGLGYLSKSKTWDPSLVDIHMGLADFYNYPSCLKFDEQAQGGWRWANADNLDLQEVTAEEFLSQKGGGHGTI